MSNDVLTALRLAADAVLKLYPGDDVVAVFIRVRESDMSCMAAVAKPARFTDEGVALVLEHAAREFIKHKGERQ